MAAETLLRNQSIDCCCIKSNDEASEEIDFMMTRRKIKNTRGRNCKETLNNNDGKNKKSSSKGKHVPDELGTRCNQVPVVDVEQSPPLHELIVIDEVIESEDDVKEFVDKAGQSLTTSKTTTTTTSDFYQSDIEIVLEKKLDVKESVARQKRVQLGPNNKKKNKEEEEEEEEENVEVKKKDEDDCKCSNCPFKSKLTESLEKLKRLRHKLKILKVKSGLKTDAAKGKKATTTSVTADSKSLKRKSKKKKKKDLGSKLKKIIELNKVQNKSAFLQGQENSSVQPASSFFIDTTGHSFVQANDLSEDQSEPNCKRDKSGKVPKKQDNSDIRCYVCNGDHFKSQCPLNKTRDRIGDVDVGRSRYHERSQFTPGILSERLRKALSIGQNEIPEFVYKMRILGYPPGWLKEAEIPHIANITMYDSEGKVDGPASASVDDDDDDSSVTEVRYDPEKLISFLGYNEVAPPHLYFDRSSYLGYPPIHECHLKSTMAAVMQRALDVRNVNVLKRKRPDDDDNNQSLPPPPPPPSKNRKTSSESVAEDLEEGEVEECSSSSPPPTPSEDRQQQQPEVVALDVDSDIELLVQDRTSTSPEEAMSLEDLEDTKSKLMMQLEEQQQQQSSSSCGNGGAAVVALGLSKEVELGTPVFVHNDSRFQKLPSAEKFASGIGDYLVFENLPKATGSFAKIRTVLATVKHKMSKLL